jgi:D-aminopeptidase
VSPRARDLGLDFPGEPGPSNALTDVPGVAVGCTTLLQGEGPLRPGHGPIRTGVTAILPHGPGAPLRPVWAGLAVLNGNGELTGSHWIREAGWFMGPIMLTNTHSVGIVHHATTRWLLDTYAADFADLHLWAMPVVAETYDGVLNDINGQHVRAEHALAALAAARGGAVAEGNVGGGTGMIAYGFKGGTGTASRRVAVAGGGGIVAALVQANHGRREWLTILGVPVGRALPGPDLVAAETGSIIVVLATDLPLRPDQLTRLAKRGALGVARGGTPGGNGSGDIFLAFSTANPTLLPQRAGSRLALDCLNDDALDPVYLAAVDAIEEAVVNAMVAARPLPSLKPAGRTCPAIDHTELVAVMRRAGRCR